MHTRFIASARASAKLAALLFAASLALPSARAGGSSVPTSSSSASDSASPDPAAAPANTTTAAADDDAHAASLSAQIYHIHPTDKIHVEVTDDDRARRDLSVAMDGTVRLAYLDEPLKISGLTINQAIDMIQKAYVDQKIFVKPQVSLEVVVYADRRISVNGQVNRPGWVNIPPEETMTLVSAVSAAGGPTRITDPDVTITRTLANGKTKIIHANLKSAMEDPSKDIPIEDGDSIYLKEDMLGSVF
jgi:protein involved in polysaccharide export with SLBB domain